MTDQTPRQLAAVEEMSEAEQLALVDREARHHLGISGQEFAQQWRAGTFGADGDPNITRIAMLLPSW